MTSPGARLTGARDRRQRALNSLALLLLAIGAGLYLYALWRMDAIAGGRAGIGAVPGAPRGVANLDRWYALRRLSNIGLGTAIAGVCAMIVATLRHSLRTRRLRDHGSENRT